MSNKKEDRSALLALWDALVARAGPRQYRLFECAVCRRRQEVLADERARGVLEMAERFAEGLVSEADLEAVRATVLAVGRNPQGASLWSDLSEAVAPDGA